VRKYLDHLLRSVRTARLSSERIEGLDRDFAYDRPDKTIAATMQEGANNYDADVVAVGDPLWLSWLEYTPGRDDHSRDLDQGDALSQLWRPCRKKVTRYELQGEFVPFFSYERSHSDTADHNVISLRPDMLRPHTYSIPEFWNELDDRTITIPYQPIRRHTWKYQNDRLRPLAEVFQKCRDHSIEDDIHRGLAKGYHLGFIASSDHQSTSASDAGVWAESRIPAPPVPAARCV